MRTAMTVREFMSAWLSENGLTETTSVHQAPCGGDSLFECQISVEEIECTAAGSSHDKEEAVAIACTNVVRKLIAMNLISEEEANHILSYQQEGNKSAKSENICHSTRSAPYRQSESTERHRSSESTVRSLAIFLIWKDNHGSTFKQSSTHEDPDLYGGWTCSNYKARWKTFLHESKGRMEMHMTTTKKSEESWYIAKVAVEFDHLLLDVYGHGEGPSKSLAKHAACASYMRQLHLLGLIENYEDHRNSNVFDQTPVYDLHISTEVLTEIDAYLRMADITHAQPDEKSLVPAILSDRKLDVEFKTLPAADSVEDWTPSPTEFLEGMLKCLEPGDTLPTEVSSQLLSDESSNEQSSPLDEFRKSLPIYERREEVLKTIQQNRVSLIVGETGSGKTTQICQYLLESYLNAGRGDEFYCIVVQPRRISAVSLANRVAKERGESLGESVGYSVRYESVTPRKRGAILFCTTGVLLRRLESGLIGVSHVIVDEVHERDVDIDLILVFLREKVSTRLNFRLVLMSATADVTMFQEYFKQCPVVKVSGRTHPVKTYFLEDALLHTQRIRSTEDVNHSPELGKGCGTVFRSSTKFVEDQETDCQLVKDLILYQVENGLRGSVLVFLDGWNTISSFYSTLRNSLVHRLVHFKVFRLHSRLPKEEQSRVFHRYPPNVMKIILTTNIAESSITIEDAVMVIDTCKVKVNVYTAEAAIQEYVTDWASQSSLKQRRGRAGRIQPGVCYHLCTKAQYEKLPPYPRPMILMTPLHLLLPRIMILEPNNIYDFFKKTIEPPPVEHIAVAQRVLYDMGLLDHKRQLTPLGYMATRLPVDPVLGKAVILGSIFGYGDFMCTLAACTDAEEMLNYSGFTNQEMQNATGSQRHCDYVKMIDLYHGWLRACRKNERAATSYCRQHGLSRAALMSVSRMIESLKKNLKKCGFSDKSLRLRQMSGCTEEWDLMSSFLTMVFSPNLCYRESKQWVVTCDGQVAKIGTPSVVLADTTDWQNHRFYIFSEKIQAHSSIKCKRFTEITAIQLLLFGSSQVTSAGRVVSVDNWLRFVMSPIAAAKIVALRTAIDRYVESSIGTDGMAKVNPPLSHELLRLLFKMSSYGRYETVRNTKIKAPITRKPREHFPSDDKSKSATVAQNDESVDEDEYSPLKGRRISADPIPSATDFDD